MVDLTTGRMGENGGGNKFRRAAPEVSQPDTATRIFSFGVPGQTEPVRQLKKAGRLLKLIQ